MAELRRPITPSAVTRLLETPDLPDRIRSMQPGDFSRLVRDIGVEDAGEILALASTEQLVEAFDEDLFANSRPGEREVFDAARFVDWLEVLSDAGERVLAERFSGLSEDFVVHALCQLIWVLDDEALSQRMAEGDDDAVLADKLLEASLNETIDGYLLVARDPRGFDAVMNLIATLDRDRRDLVERILDRCAYQSRNLVEALDELCNALSEAESLAEDVEAEREARRAKRGFVEPQAARAFLELARRSDCDPLERDALTRAYFRELEPPVPVGIEAAAERVRAPRAVPVAAPAAGRARIAGDRPTRSSHPVGGGTPGHSERGPGSILPALQTLSGVDPAEHAARAQELAYLANVLIAGGTRGGVRFSPIEAVEAATATVLLGAEIVVRRSAAGAGTVTSPAISVVTDPRGDAALSEVLRTHTADALFRVASGALARSRSDASEAYVLSASEVGPALEGVHASGRLGRGG